MGVAATDPERVDADAQRTIFWPRGRFQGDDELLLLEWNWSLISSVTQPETTKKGAPYSSDLDA